MKTSDTTMHAIGFIIAILIWASCSQHPNTDIPSANASTSISAKAQNDPHVIFIGVDGLGSHNLWPKDDTIDAPQTPHLARLISESAHSKKAKIDSRNWSGPNWAGMLTGKSSDEHMVLSNDCLSSEVPTLFDVISEKKPEFESGMVANWEMLACYSKANAADFAYNIKGSDGEVLKKVLQILDDRLPNFLFVYFGDVDTVGHQFGARSKQYKSAIETVDSAIGAIIAALKKNNSYSSSDIIVSSDHGHAIDEPGHSSAKFPVPFLVRSSRLKKGPIKQAIANKETAPLILWLLGLTAEQPTMGR